MPLGKWHERQRDMALQHAGEAVAHLGGRRADGDGARHVGGAVEILRAGIDEIERARLELALGLGARLVMHDGAVRARARDGGEAQIAEIVAAAAEFLEPVGHSDLAQSRRRSWRATRESGSAPRRRAHARRAYRRAPPGSCRPWRAGTDRRRAAPARPRRRAGRTPRTPRSPDRPARGGPPCPARRAPVPARRAAIAAPRRRDAQRAPARICGDR